MISIYEIILFLKCEKLSNFVKYSVQEAAQEDENKDNYRFFHEFFFLNVHFFF